MQRRSHQGRGGVWLRVADSSNTLVSRLTLIYAEVRVGEFRLASVDDGVDGATRFAYDLSNRTTTVTNGLGQATRYGYDDQGRLTQITYSPVGGSSAAHAFAYNAAGDLVRSVDANGRVVEMNYDADGNQVLQRDARGNTITRTFAPNNLLLTETVYTAFDPDGAGSATPQGALTSRYVYDGSAAKLLRFVVSPQGRVTEYLYNSQGLQTSVIEYASSNTFGVSTLNTTDVPTLQAMQDWVTPHLSNRLRTDRSYDARGQLLYSDTYANVDNNGQGVVATRSRTTYIYDPMGRLLKTVDGASGVTTYTYDGLDRVLTRTDPLQQGTGKATTSVYDDAGNSVTVTLENGLSTVSTYDKAGHLISLAKHAAGSVPGSPDSQLGTTTYFYDQAGRLTMTQDPTQVRSWFLYDATGRLEGTIDGNGTLVVKKFNATSQPILSIEYATLVNVAGLPSSVRLVDLSVTSSATDRWTYSLYDSVGRLQATVDALGAVTRNWYDGASRLVKSTRYATLVNTAPLTALVAQGAAPDLTALNLSESLEDRSVTYFYDADGLLRGTVDAEGYLTERKYDGAVTV